MLSQGEPHCGTIRNVIAGSHLGGSWDEEGIADATDEDNIGNTDVQYIGVAESSPRRSQKNCACQFALGRKDGKGIRELMALLSLNSAEIFPLTLPGATY